LVVAAPVYAELMAHPKAAALLDRFLSDTDIIVDFQINEDVWREAGRTFSEYLKRRKQSGGGSAKRLLVDFIIGAHAWLRTDRLLTLDSSRYTSAFPQLEIIPR
jgi:predicted nucleic acid-binding protein